MEWNGMQCNVVLCYVISCHVCGYVCGYVYMYMILYMYIILQDYIYIHILCLYKYICTYVCIYIIYIYYRDWLRTVHIWGCRHLWVRLCVRACGCLSVCLRVRVKGSPRLSTARRSFLSSWLFNAVESKGL